MTTGPNGAQMYGGTMATTTAPGQGFPRPPRARGGRRRRGHGRRERFTHHAPSQASLATVSALSEREAGVSRLVARGLSNAEIAAELFLSEATVKTYVSRLLTKLDLRDRVQIAAWAYESGLVEVDGGGR